MVTIDRWRNWQPSNEKFGTSPECEPPKPPKPTFEGFEGSISEQTQNFSDRPPDAPDAWREDFSRWKIENCVHRDGREDWGGVGCLWVDFCEWAVSNDSVPCQRATFERLLEEAGFSCAEGMVAGLLLRADLEAVVHFQNRPEGGDMPAQKAYASTGGADAF